MKTPFLIFFIHLIYLSVYAEEIPEDKITLPLPLEASIKAAPQLCNSTQEYVDTINFLRAHTKIVVPEKNKANIADAVSKGCTGAAHRFISTLTLLNEIGVDQAKTIEIAISFSNESDQIQKNFISILRHAYLTEYFDFDFRSALLLSYEFSMNMKGNPEKIVYDFEKLVQFCKSKKNISLPIVFCANFSMKLAQYSAYYPQGIFTDFETLYTELTTKRSVSIKEALIISMNVLKYGPKAKENFFQALNFALDKNGLNMTQPAAISFGVKMAERSTTHFPPPFPIEKIQTAEVTKK